MKKWITAAAVLTLSASLAVASPGGPDGKSAPGKTRKSHAARGAAFSEKLGLNASQKAQIEAIRKANRTANESFFAAARATRQEISAAREARDTAKVEALSARAAEQMAKTKALRNAERAEISKVLTVEQRTKLQALEAEFMERRGRSHDRRDGKPGMKKHDAKPGDTTAAQPKTE